MFLFIPIVKMSVIMSLIKMLLKRKNKKKENPGGRGGATVAGN